LEGAGSDVSSIGDAFEVEAAHAFVGAGDGGLEVFGEAGDGQDTTAVGDDLAVFESGAGVEDEAVLLTGEGVEAGDGFPGFVVVGIAAGCRDDRRGSAAAPGDLLLSARILR
jgi:hypothetical protein